MRQQVCQDSRRGIVNGIRRSKDTRFREPYEPRLHPLNHKWGGREPNGWKGHDNVDSSGGDRWRRYGSADEEVRVSVSGERRGAHANEGNEEDGTWAGRAWLDSETALAVKVMTWLERAVQRLGAMPVLGRSARVTSDVPECVRESREMRGEQAESSMGDRWEAFE